jgi:hypothetical protein
MHRIISLAVGLLLLATAALKLYGSNVTPVPGISWLADPAVQRAGVVWEIVLGLLLIHGGYPRVAWLASVATFATFAGISGYLTWIGQARCGCFGFVEASPWQALTLDLVVLVALAVGFPRSRIVGPASLEGSGIARSPVAWRIVLGSALLVGIVSGLAAWTYGSPQAALARIRGDTVTISPRFLDVGSGKSGASLEGKIEVRNWTNKPVRIIGGTSDCSCVVTRDLPCTIAPGEVAEIAVELSLRSKQTGAVARKAVLWTDCEQAETVQFLIGARIRE